MSESEREEIIKRRKIQEELRRKEQEKIMNQIKFLGKPHITRMLNLLKSTGKIRESTGDINIEYATAYYLLAADEDIYNKAKKYIHIDGINFKNMIAKQDFSSGQIIIVKLAANLFQWTYKKDVSPIDLIGDLDDDFFRISMNAIILRRCGKLDLGTLVNQMALRDQEGK